MLHPNTFSFLSDLANNNNRDWFNANKNTYNDVKDSIVEMADKLITGVKHFDKHIPADLTGKKALFRIYRDTRFSPDKTPYKRNLGIALGFPSYYLHIEPNNVFIAGGYYMPSAERLALIRQEIDYSGDELTNILENQSFKKHYQGLDQEQKLKKCPKGYQDDNPYIEYLKLKSFTASCPTKESDIMQKDAVEYILERYKALYPLNEFIRKAIS